VVLPAFSLPLTLSSVILLVPHGAEFIFPLRRARTINDLHDAIQATSRAIRFTAPKMRSIGRCLRPPPPR